MPAIMAIPNVAASCLHILRDMSDMYKSPQLTAKSRYLLTLWMRGCSHAPFWLQPHL
jgi:hypothetical protein